MVQNCCFSRLAQARSKGIDLGYDGVEQPVMIEGDDVLLGELCANLLENAIKYTPAGGTVTVFLRAEAGAVELRVEDSGPGIEEDQIHRAMLPFHRRTTSGTLPVPGSGWHWRVILPGCTAAICNSTAVNPWVACVSKCAFCCLHKKPQVSNRYNLPRRTQSA